MEGSPRITNETAVPSVTATRPVTSCLAVTHGALAPPDAPSRRRCRLTIGNETRDLRLNARLICASGIAMAGPERIVGTVVEMDGSIFTVETLRGRFGVDIDAQIAEKIAAKKGDSLEIEIDPDRMGAIGQFKPSEATDQQPGSIVR